MSKKLSYKGKLNIGLQDRIRLRTIKGKIGYKITKFQIMSTTPGGANTEMIGQIFKKDKTGSIGINVDFSDSDLLAVALYHDADSTSYDFNDTVIFDNEIVNQDIFVNITDASGATNPGNYYIELETMDLSEIETTMLTLKSIRTITSR